MDPGRPPSCSDELFMQIASKAIASGGGRATTSPIWRYANADVNMSKTTVMRMLQKMTRAGRLVKDEANYYFLPVTTPVVN